MATQVPSLNIVAGKADADDRVIDIPSGFDRVLGRDASADITLSDPAISRRHARLYRGTDGVWLEDLGSTNGTYINGDRLTVPYRLRDGDEVKLGNSLATFHEVVNGPDPTQVITVQEAPAAAAAPDVAGAGLQTNPAAAGADTLDVPGVGAGAAPQPVPVVSAATGPQGAAIGPQAAPDLPPAVRPETAPEPIPVANAQAPAPDEVVHQTAPDAAVAARQPAASGTACPDCSAANRPEAWFCTQCGRQLRAIPFPAGEQLPARAASTSPRFTNVHGEVRGQQFRQAMRARNGGRRVPYDESLALPTIAFRSLLVLVLLAMAVFGLVILNEGVHRVFGL